MAERAEGPPITAEEQLDAARDAIARLEDQLRRTPRSRNFERGVLRYNLGLAWQEFPGGDHELNLSRAVASLEKAVALFDAEERPVEHARAQNALGAALRELGQHEEAIRAFGAAADLVPAEISPGEHGAALNNMGLTLNDVRRYEDAIEVFERALKVFEGRDFIRQRITVLHNLGQALAASGDAEPTQRAIETYRGALDVADPEEHPYQWALLQHSLGVSYTAVDDARGAVEAFESAVRVFTRPRFPFQHALTKNNLGLAYMQIGDVSSLRRAVVCYEDALRILDVRVHKDQWEQAYRNLQLAEDALRAAGEQGTRPQHFARLAAESSDEDASRLLRDRIGEYLDLPEPRRTEALAELDHAVLGLDDADARRLTAAWLNVLMELPQAEFAAGVRARMAVMQSLDQDALGRAARILDHVIQQELLAPQRIRVRDTLVALGYERPDPE